MSLTLYGHIIAKGVSRKLGYPQTFSTFSKKFFACCGTDDREMFKDVPRRRKLMESCTV